MINWLRKKLGIDRMQREIDTIAWHIERTYGDSYFIDAKKKCPPRLKPVKVKKESKRHDELERDKKRRRKAGTSVRHSKRNTERQAPNSGL